MFRLASRPLLASSLAVIGSTVGVVAYTRNYNVVGLDATGTANWDSSRARYDDDLKVNRHKIAAAQNTTPKTPLHNSTPSNLSHNSETAHISSSGPGPAASPNFGKGAGTSDPHAPAPPGRDPANPDEKATYPGKGEKKNAEDVVKGKAEEVEEKEQSAYNEETGEINWDCPCLGGMAHGPCGPQFRAAFSCFVYSDAEPKGVECVEKFKGMQDCFREHPEVYGEEAEDDEDTTPSSSPSGTAAPEGYRTDIHPKAPTLEPPANSLMPLQTPENNPSKGVAKLQPKAKKENAPATMGASQTTPQGEKKTGTKVSY